MYEEVKRREQMLDNDDEASEELITRRICLGRSGRFSSELKRDYNWNAASNTMLQCWIKLGFLARKRDLVSRPLRNDGVRG